MEQNRRRTRKGKKQQASKVELLGVLLLLIALVVASASIRSFGLFHSKFYLSDKSLRSFEAPKPRKPASKETSAPVSSNEDIVKEESSAKHPPHTNATANGSVAESVPNTTLRDGHR